ncbi:putative mitogen-activated protein kinase 14C [Drosophila kikkawai]|uniref:mitogen-activated protein kinase n=1 Tax=Drosophila kikkawai TaxID=30033 RepID=A0A6P4JNH8_DROKI|nr:putative mitogen-activated protein kinase 14C [Drosophila kikkawai]
MAGFARVQVNGNEWVIPRIYEIVGPLGAGSFGQVAKARLQDTANYVAMKKLLRPFESSDHAKRVYREIRLLKHMDHVNVISLLDTFHSPSSNPNPTMNDFQQVYLVTHLMSEDLHCFTRRVELRNNEVKKIMYKILRGIKYIHSAGVLHRDLKPGNIAINHNLDVRILDFGMARLSTDIMSDHVGTMWYRAPELLFCWDQYTNAIDMWSVGCILAELIMGRALFPGTHSINQLELVLNFMGRPSEEFINGIADDGARKYVQNYRYREVYSFRQRFSQVDPMAVDLMEKMLEMIPGRRITADGAMNHPYLRDLIEPHHHLEDIAPAYDQNFENMVLPTNCWKELILNEIRNFNPPPAYAMALNQW